METSLVERISVIPKQYPRDLRDRAVRLVHEHRADYGTEWEAIGSIAAKLGIGSAEMLRKWVRQTEVDDGARPGVSTEEWRPRRLSPSSTGHTLVRFINEQKARFGGAEPVCRTLSGHGPKVAAAAYYKVKALSPGTCSVDDTRLLERI